MPTPPLSDEILQETVDAVHRYGSVIAAADELGINRKTFESRVSVARERGLEVILESTQRERGNIEKLKNLGYDLDAEELTPAEIWAGRKGEVERTISEMLRNQWRVIKQPKGPGVIAHFTDPHVDDPGTPLALLEQDIRESHELGAITTSGGDILNNWPLAGKLAKQYAFQECTLDAGLKCAQYYLEMLKPRVATNGNHEEMNHHLMALIQGWLPEDTITDYWAVNFRVETPDGRPVRCVLSHKFQKGSSWFHKAHGHIREMLEGQEADLLMDGHLHSDGVLDHTLPERGHSAVCVASGGYKMVDKYARRISKGGNTLKVRGRAHWIVYNPQAEFDQSLVVPFKSPQEAGAYLNGLQNLVTI